MEGFLTPDKARTVDLPGNPVERFRRLQDHAAPLLVGEMLLTGRKPFVFTRAGLVKQAEAYQDAAEQAEIIGQIETTESVQGETNGEDF
jgi:hypothetical protein